MKKSLFKSGIHILLMLLVGVSAWSCKDALDIKPEDALEPKQMYRNKFDADAAVMGIYGKVLNIAKQYVVLNELRGDLMDVTGNADEHLIQLGLHNVSADNPYADPRPFYEVILNCNDVIKNFKIMRAENKLTANDYNQRISDIGAIRSWVYLQLAIHYGNIPYVTEPLEKVDDLKDQSRFPMLSLDQVLDKLIEFSESEDFPYKMQYEAGISLITFVDNYSTEKFFINKELLLGDIHLWKGNYRTAATHYYNLMNSPAEGDYNTYRVKYADVQNNNDLAVGYIRFREQDINMVINSNTQGWRSMFARGQDALFNTEWIWVLPFDKNFNPQNPFIDLFANTGTGKYLLKPSQSIIDKWNAQVQFNDFPFDVRGRFSWNTVLGQPVIMKYLYNYDITKPLERNGKWFLSRAASLHLRFAEAANRDGRHKLAYALLNQGINVTFDTIPSPSNKEKVQATFDVVPYKFYARNGDAPRYRDTWHLNAGVRGRAYVRPAVIDSIKSFDLSNRKKPVLINLEALIVDIENKLIEESALELAFEGHRWPDLLRVAIRRNDPGFLADKVYEKLQKAGRPEATAVRAKLMNRSNWFLPFRWK